MQEVVDIVATESVLVMMLKWLEAWLKDIKLKSISGKASYKLSNLTSLPSFL